ncbi:protein DDI1 homolog 2-like [Oppia nitens]|uniref:protein DDI1 homolog 2-like n=1 Tax=Oppia nitens TaxID=1686743 RepID=UPI0023DC1DC3|nr:protein DDI1 homolog 2-like [Oppia nitens]
MIAQLSDILTVQLAETRHFLSTERPDIIQAIDGQDVDQLRTIVDNLLKTSHTFTNSINSLEEFVVILRRLHFDFIRRNESSGSSAVLMTTTTADLRSDYPPFRLPFVECMINGRKIIGLIDTGAQLSTISRKLIDQCQIGQSVDNSFRATSVGVGKQAIIGRIRSLTITIGNCPLIINLCVINTFHSDYFLIGQDFLVANRCVVYCAEGLAVFRRCQLVVKFVNNIY